MRKNSVKNTRVNGEVQRVLAEIIRGGLKDPRISPWTSVVAVEVAPDLKSCKAWISVLGDEEVRKSTLQGLKSAEGFIRRELAVLIICQNVWKSIFPVFWKTESLLLFATRIPLLVQRSRNVSSWDSRFLMISALSDLMICRLLLVRHRPLQPSDKIGWSSEKVDFLHCQVFSITSQSVRICCMHS